MIKKSLKQLYEEHQGKVTDKWFIYLVEYDRIFSAYRDSSIRLLEIGVQNGGSLDIWSQYFPNALHLIGCDINPACVKLSYVDPRINLIISDANTDNAEKAILSITPKFDVIIDDGSHSSSDIIKSFSRYWPHLSDGGVFVAEDLHCSYWQEYEGGLYDPFSSMTFFKYLADIVNYEHWGILSKRNDILAGMALKYGFAFDEESLKHIHSIEFINSVCIVRKKQINNNILGSRIIVGTDEAVIPGHKDRCLSFQHKPNEVTNFWSNRTVSPGDELIGRLVELKEQMQRIAEQDELLNVQKLQLSELNNSLSKSSLQINEQKLQLTERSALMAQNQAQIKCLDAQMSHQQDQLLVFHQNIDALHKSFSWRITAPMRFVTRQLKRAPVAVKLVLPAIQLGGGVGATVKKAINLYRREGIPGIKRGFRAASLGQQGIPSPAVVAPAVQDPQKLAPVPHDLSGSKVADGVWEWAAYDDVKTRIHQFKKTQAENVAFNTVQLVHVEADALEDTASAINFPGLITKPMVSIILPVFNHAQLTLECLLSIAGSDSTVSYEIIIADDASTDDTSRILQLVKNVKYFRNESNLGFLKNTNKALEHVAGTYVLYLNNDVQVSGAWLSTLLATFKDFPSAGAVGPAFVYPSGHLQEAGAAFNMDGTADMIGLNESPQQARFAYTRRVDYVSGACLLIPAKLVQSLGGFSEEFLPCYCEDSDLCLRIQAAGYDIYCNPHVMVMHRLSKSTDALGESYKLKCVYKNVTTLKTKWQDHLQKVVSPKVIAFYLPQFHPFSENNKWWGQGFTEWTNVSKAKPNFVGHYQPRYPADLGYYDLRLPEILAQQAALAKQYGVGGFCFYYYWFDGKRLLEQPIEQMLKSKEPDFPFCLCWANENWTRRWDGLEYDVLMAQAHSPEDDVAVINDLIRYFKDARYIRIDGRPLLLVYRVALFPNFIETAARWRDTCRQAGIGEIYLTSVESFDGVNGNRDPATFGCDAAVEFPPHGMGEAKPVPGAVLNPNFAGTVGHYNDVAVRFATRPAPAYTRFRSVMPGWDNTARRQDTSFCFDQSTPGAFQAWLEESLEQTRLDRYGDEKLVFLNAWNEWAEGAYLEPDKRFGHTYLEAVRNALDAKQLKR